MRLTERLYRSPLGRVMSTLAHAVATMQRPFMVYGYRDPTTGQFRKWTRVSSTLVVMRKERLALGDHVWVWHHSILDATEGLVIEEGVQIGAWVGIFTHGSENAVRLLGRQFVHIPNTERKGYTRGAVKIGAYSFIGAGAIILPGVTIGKGCLVGSGALVMHDLPDHAIAIGSPARVKGSTTALDLRWCKRHDFAQTYYDPEVFAALPQRE